LGLELARALDETSMAGQWHAVSACRALRIRSSRTPPGGRFLASSLRRRAWLAGRSSNGIWCLPPRRSMTATSGFYSSIINLELCLGSCREPDIRRIIRQRLAPDFARNRIREAIYLSVPGLPRHNPDGGLSVPSVGAVSFGADAAKSNVVGRYEPFRQMVGELCMVTQVPEVLLTRGLGLMRSLRPFFYQA
jgi:hypothetical protein